MRRLRRRFSRGSSGTRFQPAPAKPAGAGSSGAGDASGPWAAGAGGAGDGDGDGAGAGGRSEAQPARASANAARIGPRMPIYSLRRPVNSTSSMRNRLKMSMNSAITAGTTRLFGPKKWITLEVFTRIIALTRIAPTAAIHHWKFALWKKIAFAIHATKNARKAIPTMPAMKEKFFPEIST